MVTEPSWAQKTGRHALVDAPQQDVSQKHTCIALSAAPALLAVARKENLHELIARAKGQEVAWHETSAGIEDRRRSAIAHVQSLACDATGDAAVIAEGRMRCELPRPRDFPTTVPIAGSGARRGSASPAGGYRRSKPGDGQAETANNN